MERRRRSPSQRLEAYYVGNRYYPRARDAGLGGANRYYPAARSRSRSASRSASSAAIGGGGGRRGVSGGRRGVGGVGSGGEDRAPQRRRRATDPAAEPNRIFVGGIPKVTTEERLRAHFAKFGAIARVELTAERSFAFVTFETGDAVESVLETRMHQFAHTALGTAFIEVRRPKPRNQWRNNPNLERD